MRTKLNQNSKVKLSILYASLLVSGIAGVGSISYLNSGSVHALTYSKTTDITFTINPSVSISLSTDTLTIDDLSPSAKKESNTITLTVQSNNATGYEVGSTVGNNTNYPTTDLKHSTDYDTTKTLTKFTSLATNASIDYTEDGTNLTTGTWGYTYATSTDNGTTWGDWQSYSGLPLYTASYDNRDSDDEQTKANVPATLVSTDNPSSTKVNFKIAAAAQDQQYSGEYNNVINFVTVVNPSDEGGGGGTYMQNWSGCSSLSAGDTTTLTDSRDGTEYTVGKLADEKCWMLDNLALDLTNNDVKTAMLNESDTKTNATYAQLDYLFNGGGSGDSSSSLFQYATAGVANWTSSYSYSAPLVNLTNKDVVPTTYNGTDDPMKEQVVNGNWKVGGYYNYCAASAGTYCYGNGTSYTGSPSTSQNGVRNIDADICPSGWHMPTGNNNGEFRLLGNAITNTTSGNYTSDNYTNFRTAFRLPLSGFFYSGSPRSQGSFGYFWSSTRYNSYGMYILIADTSTIYPANYDGRNGGYSLRCVAGS